MRMYYEKNLFVMKRDFEIEKGATTKKTLNKSKYIFN